MSLRVQSALAAVSVAGAVSLLAGAPPAAAVTAGQAGSGTTLASTNAELLTTTLPSALSQALPLSQLTVGQTAAGATNGTLRTRTTLGEDVLQKSSTGKNAFGHVALASLNDGTGSQDAIQAVEAVSPPRSSDSSSLLSTPSALAPVATASLVDSVAAANTTNAGSLCVVGEPISSGTTNVASASLLPAALPAATEGATTSLANVADGVRFTSTEQLTDIPGSAKLGIDSTAGYGTLGVTLFQNTGEDISVKVLDPIVLRAVAGGVPGSAKVSYGEGPTGDASADVLQISAGGTTQTVSLADLAGTGGLKINIPGVADITIGAPATATVSKDGTSASGSADLVHVVVPGAPDLSGVSGGPTQLQPIIGVLSTVVTTLADATNSVGSALSALGSIDLHLGHLEASTTTDGLTCTLPVTKTAHPDPVTAGKEFTYTITVDNPYDCVLDPVTLTDDMTATEGVEWTVESTDPKATRVSNSQIYWSNIGPIAKHSSKQVTIGVLVNGASAPGLFTDHAVAVGECKGDAATGEDTVHLTGDVTVHVPRVTSTGTLAETGSSPVLPLVGVVLVGAGGAAAVVRRRRRSFGAG